MISDRRTTSHSSSSFSLHQLVVVRWRVLLVGVLICFHSSLPYPFTALIRGAPGRTQSTPSSVSLAMTSSSSADPISSLAEEVQLAVKYHKEGELSEAIRAYEHVIPRLSGAIKASLCGNVGALHMNNGDYESAKRHFLTSIEADPDNASMHFNLAVLLTSKLGQHGKAIRHCGIALNLDPSNHKVLHLMGNILQNIGRPDEAEQYFIAAESMALQAQGVSADDEATGASGGGASAAMASLRMFSSKVGDRVSAVVEGRDYVMECISESPLLWVVHDLLTEEECDRIMTRSASLLERSYVMGGGAAELVPSDPYRSSHNAWLPPDDLLASLQLRLSQLMGVPRPYLQLKSEELQVVRYVPGEQFKVHHDSSAFLPRLFTALVYLNSPRSATPQSISGGETWFPYASKEGDRYGVEAAVSSTAMSREEGDDWTVDLAIARALTRHEEHVVAAAAVGGGGGGDDDPPPLEGLKVTPVAGKAVIFANHLIGGEVDPSAVHAGLPLRRSDAQGSSSSGAEKWVANYWVEMDDKTLGSYLLPPHPSSSSSSS